MSSSPPSGCSRSLAGVGGNLKHRSQFNFIDGFAKHMRDALPKASFIGFTGTPIESGDRNTQAVFGDLASQARHQLVSQPYDSRYRAP